jgi:hypothetical protein
MHGKRGGEVGGPVGTNQHTAKAIQCFRLVAQPSTSRAGVAKIVGRAAAGGLMRTLYAAYRPFAVST